MITYSYRKAVGNVLFTKFLEKAPLIGHPEVQIDDFYRL